MRIKKSISNDEKYKYLLDLICISYLFNCGKQNYELDFFKEMINQVIIMIFN